MKKRTVSKVYTEYVKRLDNEIRSSGVPSSHGYAEYVHSSIEIKDVVPVVGDVMKYLHYKVTVNSRRCNIEIEVWLNLDNKYWYFISDDGNTAFFEKNIKCIGRGGRIKPYRIFRGEFLRRMMADFRDNFFL